MNKLVSLLSRKGVLATTIGLLFALPVNCKMIYAFYKNVEMSKDQLWTAVILNAISVVWFILPSKIEIKSKIMNIIIED